MSGDEDKGEGFLRRWSRRKGTQPKAESSKGDSEAQTALAEPAAEAQLELPPEAPVRGRMITTAPGEVEAAGAPEEETEVDEADLPDVESLEADSDFTPFLKKGVSEQLQRRALRKLWLSDPVLANVDGLLDYGEDFTDAAMVVADMKTAYTVGRGMVPPPEEELPEEGTEEEAVPEAAASEVDDPGAADPEAADSKIAGPEQAVSDAEISDEDESDSPVASKDEAIEPAETTPGGRNVADRSET